MPAHDPVTVENDWYVDPYHSPEKYGLTPLAEVDYSDGNYVFDFRVVWVDDEGTLYTARDSGCSCPSPFEDYKKLDQLDVVDYNEFRELRDEVRKYMALPGDYNSLTAEAGQEFLSKVYRAGNW